VGSMLDHHDDHIGPARVVSLDGRHLHCLAGAAATVQHRSSPAVISLSVSMQGVSGSQFALDQNSEVVAGAAGSK
jgi:hypothetical protein